MMHLFAAGSNRTPIWGMTSRERLDRIARAQGLGSADDAREADLLVNLNVAFDPAWLKQIARMPDHVLTLGGVPALAHATRPESRSAIAEAMAADRPLATTDGLELLDYETSGEIENEALRKREKPFLGRLEPGNVKALERASYVGAYKGVTDILTKYLWPEWALVLTRVAARIGISPNMVTTIGALLCAIATWCFWEGRYWEGLLIGLVFMILDTVDGKLARCTITASWWGNIFDHGIDLIHPPIWYYAWGVGLASWGLAFEPQIFAMIMAVLVGGYVVQRLIEGAFIKAFGMHIHVWRKVDSDFRLITARRNPNWVIMLASLPVGRPDWGLAGVAIWTVLSLVVHAVQLGQAFAARARGQEIRSWLS
jgi:phosphatidylglycerophosphate synthase